MCKVILLAGICLSLLGSQVLADTIKLKNGDRLTGSIVKSDEKTIVIKTEYAGVITVNWDAVQDVDSIHDLNVFSKSGQKIVGKLTAGESKVEVTTKDAGKVELAKSDITTMRNADEQAA